MAEQTHDLLLEIGTEEIPARFCPPALQQLGANANKALREARFDHAGIDLFGTPRRLVLLVRSLAVLQHDQEISQKGPSRKAAFDAAGQPTIPAIKFAQSQGVAVDALELRTDEKGGEYLFARRLEKGRPAAAVLPDLLSALVLSLDWPKSMRWADRSIRYARPIRWILALHGTSQVDFTVDGIASSATTMGHRTLGPSEPIAVTNPVDYFIKIAAASVMVDPMARRHVIWQQVQAEAQRAGGKALLDEALLEENTWLVEQPVAFTGSFAESFLDVPAEVLVSTMKGNQRYFPVYGGAEGQALLPRFIALRNGGTEGIDLVRAGNEKVLAARLADARFFWDEDRKQPLAAYVERLKTVVFQEKLGSQYQRVQRLTGLAEGFALALGLPDGQKQQAVAAASLCKADLVTRMVFEFPEVQGYMGQQYLLREGGDPAVATAIFEHYLPRGAGDELPRSGPGIAVGLADKLDTLAGYFLIGMIPTGSQDPYALRRAAQGAIQTIVENRLQVDLAHLVDRAMAGYAMAPEQVGKARQELLDFLRARIKVLMEGKGVRYDVIDAVLAAGFSNAYDAMRRAEALGAMLGEPSFAAVTGAFKRVANLAAKSGVQAAGVSERFLIEAPERDLYAAFVELQAELRAAMEAGEYERFYRLATRLKAPVDAFLDRVRVNVDDPAIAANRIGLLTLLADQLSAPAELGRLAG